MLKGGFRIKILFTGLIVRSLIDHPPPDMRCPAFVLLALPLLCQLSHSEVDIPINYKIMNRGYSAEKCIHEDFINNRQCTQEAAKIYTEICEDVYFTMVDGVEQTSKTCGGGTKFGCDDSRTECKLVGTPATERIPCCICTTVDAEIKKWDCGTTSHAGKITKEVINFCHPALEYDNAEFNQAMDDDVLPGAGYCDNNFAAGNAVMYQFYCDELTGSLQCGGGNRGHGRSFVLDNSSKTIQASVFAIVLSLVVVVVVQWLY